MYALWQEHQQLMRHDKIHPTQDLYYESYNYKKWQFCVSITIIYIGAYTRSALKHNINLHLHAR